MNLLLLYCQLPSESLSYKLIGWIIPFLLGLFSSFFIDLIRNSIKNLKNREFIKFYLKNSIYKNLPKLELDYETIKKKIETYQSDGKNTISAHEDFNTNVLEGISSVDYYSAFKKKFVLLNEIISSIRLLSQNLPADINNDFYQFLDSHLKEKGKVGDMNHVLTCYACNHQQEATIELLTNRIRETVLLRKKIEELIK